MTIQKLLTSSADPKKTSLFVKGILVALVPLVMAFTGASEAYVSAIVDGIVDVVFYGTALLSSVQIVYGLARKLQFGRWSAIEE